MRIVYKPLISSIPIIGGMQLFFLNNPDIDFNMLGVADVLDMPGLRWVTMGGIFPRERARRGGSRSE